MLYILNLAKLLNFFIYFNSFSWFSWIFHVFDYKLQISDKFTKFPIIMLISLSYLNC